MMMGVTSLGQGISMAFGEGSSATERLTGVMMIL
jgi:hypothetical protein